MVENEQKLSDSTEVGSRAKIIAASIDEFAEFGVSGARVDRIAHRAGINKAMIYYYYQSKENLYREAVRYLIHSGATQLKGRLNDAATIDQVLYEFANMHTHLFTNVPGFRTMALRELTKSNSYLLDEFANLLAETGIPAALQRHIQQGMKSGELKPIDGRQVMAAFISLSLGYLLISPLTDRVLTITDKDKFIEDRKRVIVDIFLNGVRTR